MKLLSFSIQNYRSISDSGVVSVDRICPLVGRNESGKTNLLRALASLNGPEGPAVLDRNKDFPRNRRLNECTEETHVVNTKWALSEGEAEALRDVWPRARADEPVTVFRGYGPNLSVSIAADVLEMDANQIARDVKNASAMGRAVLTNIPDEAEKESAEQALKAFENDAKATNGDDPQSWASGYSSAEAALRSGLIGGAKPVLDSMEDSLEALDEAASRISSDA